MPGLPLAVAGTIFQDARTPLRIWFRAAWLMSNARYGVNAVTIHQQLGFGNYETAWAWLHKFRRAMVRPDRYRLSGLVEVDEPFAGGEEERAIGRPTNSKCLVAGAAEARGAGVGRIRLATISNASQPSLETFVEEVVEPGSTIHTDGWRGCLVVCSDRTSSAPVPEAGCGTVVPDLSVQGLGNELERRANLTQRERLRAKQRGGGAYSTWRMVDQGPNSLEQARMAE